MLMKSQTDRLYYLLKDGQPHRTDEVCQIVYGNSHLGLARISARIWDIKKKYNLNITGWRDKINPTLYWYQIEKIKLEQPKIKITPEQMADFNYQLSMR